MQHFILHKRGWADEAMPATIAIRRPALRAQPAGIATGIRPGKPPKPIGGFEFAVMMGSVIPATLVGCAGLMVGLYSFWLTATDGWAIGPSFLFAMYSAMLLFGCWAVYAGTRYLLRPYEDHGSDVSPIRSTEWAEPVWHAH